MEKKQIFEILGIEETTDENEIATAYRTLLKVTHPEENPEGFKKLRQAYEEAIYMARHPEEEEQQDEGPKTEVDIWMEQVAKVYDNLVLRCDENVWKELFLDPVCEGLDTFLEARNKFLAFFMNHIYVPRCVWLQADKTFQIREELSELTQHFPSDYLHYVVEHIENETFLRYDLFEYGAEEVSGEEADGYINAYFELRNQLEEMSKEECEQAFNKLDCYNVYHPFVEAERLRYYVEIEEIGKARDLAEQLLQKCPDSHYALNIIGEVFWKAEEKERAYECWKKVLELEPEHYYGRFNTACYYMDKGQYYDATQLLHKLLDVDANDQDAKSMLFEANEFMIEELSECLRTGKEDARFPGDELTLELAIFFAQNERLEEAISLLKEFEPTKEKEFDYVELLGHILKNAKKYEEAIPYLEKALELLNACEKENRKATDLHNAYTRLGVCYQEAGQVEKAEEILKEGISVLEENEARLSCMETMARLLVGSEQYEKAIDVCDSIIREDEEYFPAYVHRQKAFYMLRKPQEVVDDYYKAINIYAGYYQPYLYALEVFYAFRQYEDARGVAKLARENNVLLTPRMQLLEAKILRIFAESNEDRELPRKLLMDMRQELKDHEEVGDDEILYELALLARNDQNLEEAISYIQEAIKIDSEFMIYHIVYGQLLADTEEYEKALKEYEIAKEEYKDSPIYHYGCGICYEGMEQMEKAVPYFEKTLELENVYASACEKLSDYYRDLYEKVNKPEYLEKAISYLTRQIVADEDAYYLIGRGLLYLNNLYLEEAEKDFQKALEYVPEDWFILECLGRCARYRSDYDCAISYFKKSISCIDDDRYVSPYDHLITCYKIIFDYDKAVAVCKEVLERYPDRIGFWADLGDIYIRMDEFEKALEAYEKSGIDETYYGNIATIYLKMGDMQQFHDCYEKSLTVAEDLSNQYYEYGTSCMFETKEYDRAIPLLEKSIELCEDLEDKYIYFADIATCYYMLKQDDKAKEAAEQALKWLGQHVEELGCTEEEYMSYRRATAARIANKAWILMALGQKEEAVKIFDDMAKMQKCRQCKYQGCFESKLYLGRYYEREGNPEKAIAFYEETLKCNPGNEEARISLEQLKL